MFMALCYPTAQTKKKYYWKNTAAMYTSSWGKRSQGTNQHKLCEKLAVIMAL